MNVHELASTAQALVAKGKGILAADESTGTIERRLKSINTPNTEDNRRAWRQLLFTTPKVSEYISGVILYDETLRQRAENGTPLVDILQKNGIIPGIKVDAGTKPLPFYPNETITEGLDGLRKRLDDYRSMGARFAKWRAVITIGNGTPSSYAIHVNAHTLARYAAVCQEAGLVPIVEPEVLMDGNHGIDRCLEATEATLRSVFDELALQRVALEGMMLKPNMVLSGIDAPNRATPDEVADATIRCFMRVVPAAVPGIVFVSGGQGDEEATVNLNAINKRKGEFPWQMSYSYGRGLQATPLKAWGGLPANVARGQQAFYQRAKMTSAAREGQYSPALEKATA